MFGIKKRAALAFEEMRMKLERDKIEREIKLETIVSSWFMTSLNEEMVKSAEEGRLPRFLYVKYPLSNQNKDKVLKVMTNFGELTVIVEPDLDCLMGIG